MPYSVASHNLRFRNVGKKPFFLNHLPAQPLRSLGGLSVSENPIRTNRSKMELEFTSLWLGNISRGDYP